MPSCSGSFFFCPLLSFAFSSFLSFLLFPQISLRRSTLRNDSFRGLESWFHYSCLSEKALLWESWLLSYFPVLHLSLSEAFLFSQLGRYFSPTGQVILRAFWITMQRYEIPICQVCDSMRYHAIAEHFLKNPQPSTLKKPPFPAILSLVRHPPS